MLISATFQAELIHHLDDELSKQMAVAASEQTAKQARLGKASLKDTIAAISMIGKIVAEVPGVKPAMVAAATLACIAENTGLALDTMRQTLPAEAPEAVGKLNASQIGKELGISAIAANRRLALLGFQRKPEGGDWELTEAGTTHGEAIPFTRNGHAGYQILWNQSVIEVLREAV
ncbi:hypothetical protein [Methylomagnum ishizawai]|nr:hypothetical protein [Methylomagnum ishizawai]